MLAELSAEHREFFENYMDIVDHAHFQEEQRAYYQGMVDVMQIFDGLGILKERNKSERSAYAYQRIVQTGWMAYQEADHPVFLQNNSETIQKNRNLSAILFHGSYMYEDRLLPVQEWWLSDRLYILKDKPTVFGNPDYQLELPDKRTDQQRCVKLE